MIIGLLTEGLGTTLTYIAVGAALGGMAWLVSKIIK